MAFFSVVPTQHSARYQQKVMMCKRIYEEHMEKHCFTTGSLNTNIQISHAFWCAQTVLCCGACYLQEQDVVATYQTPHAEL